MTATEPRWTVDGGWVLDRHGDRRLWLADNADLFRTALDREYRLRELPDGVELHRDGTMWAQAPSIPDGWERYIGSDRWIAKGNPQVGWWMVRPPQEPPTVLVPLHECGGRIIKGHDKGITDLTWAEDGWLAEDGDGWIFPLDLNADGTVEVLR